MIRSFYILVMGVALVLHVNCGGPADLPQIPGGQSNPSLSPCDAANTGLDCDSDGLTDACEEALGTEKCNADSDGDGIGDKYDTPPGGNESDQDALRNAMYQDLADSLLLGSATMANSAPGGHTIAATTQNFAFGNLANYPPSLLQSKLSDKCTTSSHFFIRVTGQVDSRPAIIELCGLMDKDAKASADLSGATLLNWVGGYASNGKYTGPFDMKQLESPKTKGEMTFTALKGDTPLNICGWKSSICTPPLTSFDIYYGLTSTIKNTYKATFVDALEKKYDAEVVFKKTETFTKIWKRPAGFDNYISSDNRNNFINLLGPWVVGG